VSDLFEDDRDDDDAIDDDFDALERETAARRLVEALIFASADPVGEDDLAAELPADIDLAAVLARLEADYAGRGEIGRASCRERVS
jgi:segregation and condensation protein B